MLEEIFQEILEKRDAWIMREKGGPYAKNNPTAGDISDCARETALGILHSEARPPFETSLLHRFEAGDHGERLGIAKLQLLGFEIVEQQRWYDFKDSRGRRIFRGKIDGKLRHPAYPKPVILDWKTVEPNLFPRFHTYQDLLDHRLFRKYIKQLNLYLFMEETEVGFLMLDNLKGQIRPIEVPFLEDIAEKALNQCRQAVDAIEAIQAGHLEEDALPPYSHDSSTCERCWCRGRVCFPPMVREGYQAINDDVLAGLLDRRAELEESAAEYKAIDKQIKEMVTGKTGLVVGNWLVEGEEKKRNMSAQPAKTAHYWQSKFIRLQEMEKAA